MHGNLHLEIHYCNDGLKVHEQVQILKYLTYLSMNEKCMWKENKSNNNQIILFQSWESEYLLRKIS